jgi:CRP-like cAMP-binding protein
LRWRNSLAQRQIDTMTATIDPSSLAAMELFRDLGSMALKEAISVARIRRIEKQTQIFNQGDPAERAHAVIEGSVRISQSGFDGGQVAIRFIGPGEMFGTVALFTDREYPADAFAMADTVEISWSEADLLGLIDRHPRIALNIIAIIGTRLKEVQERVRELATQPAERRIAQTLLRLARQAGQGTTGGTAIEFPLRRKDIADISGTTLYTASRILSGWQKRGLVSNDSHRLIIRKLSDIRRIADQPAG